MSRWGEPYHEVQKIRLDKNRTVTITTTYVNHYASPPFVNPKPDTPVDYKARIGVNIAGDLTKEELIQFEKAIFEKGINQMADLEEDKFIVINNKHLNDMPATDRHTFLTGLAIIQKYLPENKYYVCNQDEPYAEEVIDTILSGEDAKDVVDAEFEPEPIEDMCFRVINSAAATHSPQVQVFKLQIPNQIAEIAKALTGQLIMASQMPSFNDDAASLATNKSLTPGEIANKACTTAQMLWDEFKVRGWLLNVPAPPEVQKNPESD